MCSTLHAPRVATSDQPHAPDSDRFQITPEDLAVVELITRADRKRLQRAVSEAMGSTLLADSVLCELAQKLRGCRVMDLTTRGLIADHLRTAMLAHHGALLRILEAEELSKQIGGGR